MTPVGPDIGRPDEVRAGLPEPTLLDAIWNRRRVVAPVVIVFMLVSFLLDQRKQTSYEGRGAVVVTDPVTSSQLAPPNASQAERYVLDQIEILRSPRVAQRAAELAVAAGADTLTTADFLQGMSIIGRRETNLIEIRFRSSEPGLAETGLRALLDAYEDVRRQEAAAQYEVALLRIDGSISSIDESLLRVAQRIRDLRTESTTRLQIDAVVEDYLRAVQASPNSEDAALRAEALAEQLTVAGLIAGVEERRPEVAAQLEEQRRLIGRRAELATQRDEIAVQAELAGGGVFRALGDEVPVRAISSDPVRGLAVAAVLGLLAGAGLAYLVALRQQRFIHRNEPGYVLGAPLLAEVPDFAHEGLRSTRLPAAEAPESVSGRSFQFAAASLDSDALGHRAVLAVVSARQGDGRTTVTANLALAGTRDGRRVTVIDADLDHQDLSVLLSPGTPSAIGLAEMSFAGVPMQAAAVSPPSAGPGQLTLIGGGRVDSTAVRLFRHANTRLVLHEIRAESDLVLLDLPPFGDAAYNTVVMGLVDGVVVVVEHESAITELQDLAERLALLRVPVAGYIYNWAPLRRRGPIGWLRPPSMRGFRLRAAAPSAPSVDADTAAARPAS